MKIEFQPALSVLPEQQRRLWPALRDVPSSFVLCGGTAIALQLSHRASLDFDFIASQEFDPDVLYGEVHFLRNSKTVQKSPNTLTCIVERDGPIQLSFFGTPNVRLIGPSLIAPENGLQVASLLDLAGMKAAVVQKRAEAKDYIDLDAIIDRGAIDLPTALSAARTIYGEAFNPVLTLKSLSFFGDGDLDSLHADIRRRLTVAVRAVDLNKLPNIQRP